MAKDTPWSKDWIAMALRHINRNVDFAAFFGDYEPDYAKVRDGSLSWPDREDAPVIHVARELLEALKDMVAQYRCDPTPCGFAACKLCKRTLEYEKLIARAEGRE